MKRLCSFVATREEITLLTQNESGGYSWWSAINEDTYDTCCDDPGCRFVATRGSSQGIGHTEWDAIQDFFDQLEERE